MRFQDFAQAQGYARTDYELTRHAPPCRNIAPRRRQQPLASASPMRRPSYPILRRHRGRVPATEAILHLLTSQRPHRPPLGTTIRPIGPGHGEKSCVGRRSESCNLYAPIPPTDNKTPGARQACCRTPGVHDQHERQSRVRRQQEEQSSLHLQLRTPLPFPPPLAIEQRREGG